MVPLANTNDVPPAGPEKFAKFLADNGISKRKAARDLKVSAPAILDWISSHNSPEPPNRKAIRVYTRGIVTEDDWETEDDRQAARRLDEVRPFEGAGHESGEHPASQAPTGTDGAER